MQPFGLHAYTLVLSYRLEKPQSRRLLPLARVTSHLAGGKTKENKMGLLTAMSLIAPVLTLIFYVAVMIFMKW